MLASYDMFEVECALYSALRQPAVFATIPSAGPYEFTNRSVHYEWFRARTNRAFAFSIPIMSRPSISSAYSSFSSVESCPSLALIASSSSRVWISESRPRSRIRFADSVVRESASGLRKRSSIAMDVILDMPKVYDKIAADSADGTPDHRIEGILFRIARPVDGVDGHEGRSRLTGVEVLDGLGSTEMLHIFVSARPGRSLAGSPGEAGSKPARVSAILLLGVTVAKCFLHDLGEQNADSENGDENRRLHTLHILPKPHSLGSRKPGRMENSVPRAPRMLGHPCACLHLTGLSREDVVLPHCRLLSPNSPPPSNHCERRRNNPAGSVCSAHAGYRL